MSGDTSVHYTRGGEIANGNGQCYASEVLGYFASKERASKYVAKGGINIGMFDC